MGPSNSGRGGQSTWVDLGVPLLEHERCTKSLSFSLVTMSAEKIVVLETPSLDAAISVGQLWLLMFSMLLRSIVLCFGDHGSQHMLPFFCCQRLR